MFYEENQPNEPNDLVYSNMLAGARIVENQIKAGISTWKNCSP
jgi:hypothetical protein